MSKAHDAKEAEKKVATRTLKEKKEAKKLKKDASMDSVSDLAMQLAGGFDSGPAAILRAQTATVKRKQLRLLTCT
jgi:hypothetical protein